MIRPRTLGELKSAGIRTQSVKDEIRRNLLAALARGDNGSLFPGIIGYEESVVPQVVNALLSKHDFILLGLRGQAKSRILRSLTAFLDPAIPALAGCPIRDDPFKPVCKACRRLLAEQGDAAPVEWIGAERRFNEKLATPDVTIADLLGDIDPIKAATRRLEYGDEEVLHFGLVPRSHRGILAINELPDLQPRIQVGLLNIMEERDIQIRGFPIRLPLDILLVYSANPEDYTSRGNIITPLRDRIASQILTHYPASIEDALSITRQESWTRREGAGAAPRIPDEAARVVERIAFHARKSAYVDQSSGVSARLSISAMENLVSNLERRAARTGEKTQGVRVVDLYGVLPSITGKIELVYEGEQQGAVAVARQLLGAALGELFKEHFPDPHAGRKAGGGPHAGSLPDPYKAVSDWFAKGNRVEVGDGVPQAEYLASLERVPGLKAAVQEHWPTKDAAELGFRMELVLEGLHLNSVLAKEDAITGAVYIDLLKSMSEQFDDPPRRGRARGPAGRDDE